MTEVAHCWKETPSPQTIDPGQSASLFDYHVRENVKADLAPAKLNAAEETLDHMEMNSECTEPQAT